MDGKKIKKNQSMQELPRARYLDGWRGLSILCVLQGHFFNLPIDLGGFGVCMFFSLSGMLMSNILFIQRQPLSKFYRRRISRIFPAFILFAASIFLLSELWGQEPKLNEFISTILFTRTYYPFPGIWNTGMPIGHIWSLNVEEHAYVFMSLLTAISIIRKKEAFFLVGCGAICIFNGFLYIKLGDNAPFWGALGSEVAASFLLISAGYHLMVDRFKIHVKPWLPIFALLASICINQIGLWWMHPMASPILLAVAVNHLSDSYAWFHKNLSALPLRKIGLWSFSIYLWQQPFYSVKNNFVLGAIGALAFAMTVALISFYVVEQPIRTWLNKNWNSWLPLRLGNAK